MDNKSHQNSVNKYNSKTYDRVYIRVYKGESDIIKSHADSLGMSVNNYIRSLLVADGVLSSTKE